MCERKCNIMLYHQKQCIINFVSNKVLQLCLPKMALAEYFSCRAYLESTTTHIISAELINTPFSLKKGGEKEL